MASAKVSERPEPRDLQRQLDRTRCPCLAYIVGSPDTPVRGIARVVDVSPKGIGLVLAQGLPLGARVVIEWMLPSGARMRATGEIVHAAPVEDGHTRVGVRLESATVATDDNDDGR